MFYDCMLKSKPFMIDLVHEILNYKVDNILLLQQCLLPKQTLH